MTNQKFPRRTFLRLAAGATALPILSRIAWAQAYPSRPVRLIVGFAPGAAADTVARLMGQLLSNRLGHPVIVENRVGAGSSIATETALKASPDGHTLLFVTPANTINSALYDKLSYNFIRDTTPVAGILRQPLVMVVHPSFPARTMSEFIAYAKANPNSISIASPGTGTSQHVAAELLKIMADIKLVHVPYRGGAPATADLLSGQVHASINNLPGVIEFVKTGRLRALAVTTTSRSEVLPNLPTMNESIPGFEVSSFFGIGAPRNTSGEIVRRLNADINASLADPRIIARFSDDGATVLAVSPADFGKLLADETEKWAKVAKIAGIRPE
jgi:tripartite-type tricarboxylate transporter receptor subunit TctC